MRDHTLCPRKYINSLSLSLSLSLGFKTIHFTLGDHCDTPQPYFCHFIYVSQLLSIYLCILVFVCVEKENWCESGKRAKQWIMLFCFLPSLLPEEPFPFFALSFLIRLKRSDEIHVILWLFFSYHFSFATFPSLLTLHLPLPFWQPMSWLYCTQTKSKYDNNHTHTHTRKKRRKKQERIDN